MYTLVFMMTGILGSINLRYGFSTPSLAINVSNIFTVINFFVCGAYAVFLLVLYSKFKGIKTTESMSQE